MSFEVVPLSRLNNLETEGYAFHIQLPDYAPSEELGLDIGRLNRIKRWTGFGHLILNTYAGDTTEATPVVASLAPDGSATAGSKFSTEEADLYDTDMTKCTWAHNQFPEYCRPSGLVKLNTNEILQRLSTDTKTPGALRDPQAWADQLNSSLTDGVLSLAKQNLYLRHSIADKIMSFYFAAASAIVCRNYPAEIPAYTVGMSLVHQTLGRPLMARNRYGLSGERMLSVFPGVSLDRLLITTGLLKASKLIRPIK